MEATEKVLRKCRAIRQVRTAVPTICKCFMSGLGKPALVAKRLGFRWPVARLIDPEHGDFFVVAPE